MLPVMSGVVEALRWRGTRLKSDKAALYTRQGPCNFIFLAPWVAMAVLVGRKVEVQERLGATAGLLGTALCSPAAPPPPPDPDKDIAPTRPVTPDTERFSPSPHHSSSQNLLEILYNEMNRVCWDPL